MTQVIWVDSRMRVSGTDSDFEVALRESVHLSDARVRVDKLTFVDSFFTTDAGQYLYFGAANNGLSYVSVPQAAYTGFTLASAIQAATGRDTAYSVMTNSITHALAANAPWLSDADLAARSGAYPSGASSSDPRSLNASLGEGTTSGSMVTWAFVRMAPPAQQPPEVREPPRAARDARHSVQRAVVGWRGHAGGSEFSYRRWAAR